MKLEHGAVLTAADRAKLEEVTSHTRRVLAYNDLIHEGDRPERMIVVLDGFAYRYKAFSDGRRQVLSYLIPGDMCDLYVGGSEDLDYSVGTLTACTIAEITPEVLNEMTVRYPSIGRALQWARLIDERILREWFASMGQRSTGRQLGRLLCELLVRLRAVDRASQNSFEFPITQDVLADTLGRTPVHVNRVLQRLRRNGLIIIERRRITIPDAGRLADFAHFDSRYLRLKKS